MKHNLINSLNETRKAYRLIYAYQRRIVDLTKYISESMKYSPYWWDNEYFNVRSNTHPVNRSAFDFVPFYVGTYMLFLKEGQSANKVKVGEGILDIQIDIDDCFKESKHEPNTLEFEDSENCSAIFYMGAIISQVEEEKNWLQDVYYQLEYPEDKMDEFVIKVDDKYTCLVYSCKLEMLYTKDSVDELIKNFKKEIEKITKNR